MSKHKDHDEPAAAAVQHEHTSQDAPAAFQPQAASPPVTAGPSPAPPQPLSIVASEVAQIVSHLSAISGQLTLAQRRDIIEALNVHLQPKPTAPSPYDGVSDYRFRVTWSNQTADVIAKGDREAWAMACDGWKSWPSPKAGKVECLGEVEPPPSAPEPRKAISREVAARPA